MRLRQADHLPEPRHAEEALRWPRSPLGHRVPIIGALGRPASSPNRAIMRPLLHKNTRVPQPSAARISVIALAHHPLQRL